MLGLTAGLFGGTLVDQRAIQRLAVIVVPIRPQQRDRCVIQRLPSKRQKLA